MLLFMQSGAPSYKFVKKTHRHSYSNTVTPSKIVVNAFSIFFCIRCIYIYIESPATSADLKFQLGDHHHLRVQDDDEVVSVGAPGLSPNRTKGSTIPNDLPCMGGRPTINIWLMIANISPLSDKPNLS